MSVNFIRKNHFFLTQNQLNALILFRCTIFHFPFIVVDSWIGLVLRTPFPLEQFSLRTMACEMSQAPKTNSHTLLLFSPLYKWIGLCYLFPIECAMNSWNTCCSHNTILCGVWNNVAKKQTSSTKIITILGNIQFSTFNRNWLFIILFQTNSIGSIFHRHRTTCRKENEKRSRKKAAMSAAIQ